MKILRSTPFKPFNPRPVEAVGEPDMVLETPAEKLLAHIQGRAPRGPLPIPQAGSPASEGLLKIIKWKG